MKYKITAALPFNIRVEYEDGSWANVPITPDYTLEQIDDAVSNFDPDFLPDSNNFNKNITVGEERVSNKLEKTRNSFSNINVEGNFEEREKFISPIPSIFGKSNPIYAALLANYFSKKGDNRIEKVLFQNLEDVINSQNLTVDQILKDLNYRFDDIFILAENELKNEIN